MIPAAAATGQGLESECDEWRRSTPAGRACCRFLSHRGPSHPLRCVGCPTPPPLYCCRCLCRRQAGPETPTQELVAEPAPPLVACYARAGRPSDARRHRPSFSTRWQPWRSQDHKFSNCSSRGLSSIMSRSSEYPCARSGFHAGAGRWQCVYPLEPAARTQAGAGSDNTHTKISYRFH